MRASRWGPSICSPYNATRRDAARKEEESETRCPCYFPKWDRDGGTKKGKWGGKKEGKGWEREGWRRGGTGEERSRIIASHSRRILHLLLLHGEGVGVHASRRNRCPASDWRLARDRPSPIGG